MDTKNVARYSRQLMIPEFGVEGQEKLFNAKVLVVGAGGLGCPALLYLAAAGIGTIGIIDFDKVDISNLQRQILFSESDVGRNKVDGAAERIHLINSDIKINKILGSISIDNALGIVSGYDVVIDSSDNFSTRYTLSDACCIRRIPLVSGSLFRLEGQVSVFNLNEQSPCYRCLYPSPPPSVMIPNCSEGGALGAVAGIVGCIQATECIKIILNKGETLSEKVMHLNFLHLDFSLLSVKKLSSCLVCAAPHSHATLNPEWYAFDGLKQICLRIKTISGKDLLDDLTNHPEKITFINVKESWENHPTKSPFNEIAIPLSVIEKEPKSVVGQLSHHGKNVFYCEDGSRSDQAVSIIERELGHINLYSFKGDPNTLFT